MNTNLCYHFFCSIYLKIQFWDSMLMANDFLIQIFQPIQVTQELIQPEKTADISRYHNWFNDEMTCEERAQNFHTDDASLPDLRGASEWWCLVQNLLQPIRGTTQIWEVTRHQYRISAIVSQMSFFSGKPVMTSRNFGCFLWLELIMLNNDTTNKSDDG